MERRRRVGVRWVASTAVTLLLCELLLRCMGVGPWRAFDDLASQPRMSDPDEALGWVNRPGRYRYDAGDGAITVSVAADGSRGTKGTGHTVGLYGGSFVFGTGVSDDEVVSARLAALRPDLRVVNRAVPGYGTLQASLLAARQPRPRTVVYGLVGLHDARNGPATAWLHALDRSSRGFPAAVPGARWDGERLVYAEPVAYRHWAASEHVALIDLVERTWIGLGDRFLRTKSETTVQLILAFRAAVEEQGGRFVVAVLHAPERAGYHLRRLEEERVEHVDLRHPQYPGWQTADGHPDPRVHAAWAEHLAEVL